MIPYIIGGGFLAFIVFGVLLSLVTWNEKPPCSYCHRSDGHSTICPLRDDGFPKPNQTEESA